MKAKVQLKPKALAYRPLAYLKAQVPDDEASEAGCVWSTFFWEFGHEIFSCLGVGRPAPRSGLASPGPEPEEKGQKG